MASYVLTYCCLILIFQIVWAGDHGNDGFIDRLSDGMKSFLGSESVALKVAEFVVRAFKTNTNPTNPIINRNSNYPNNAYVDKNLNSEESFEHDSPNRDINKSQNPMTPLKHLVKLLGLQPTQISAVAVNALIFVAQMISTFLAGPKGFKRPHRTDDLKTWILNKNSRKLQDLIATAKNDSLSDLIGDVIDEQGSEEETSCIRLLVCKIKPYIAKMQMIVFANDLPDDEDSESFVMYRHLPSKDAIRHRSNFCEKQHNKCHLYE